MRICLMRMLPPLKSIGEGAGALAANAVASREAFGENWGEVFIYPAPARSRGAHLKAALLI